MNDSDMGGKKAVSIKGSAHIFEASRKVEEE